jgi:hypothetical protein
MEHNTTEEFRRKELPKTFSPIDWDLHYAAFAKSHFSLAVYWSQKQ